MSLMRAAATRQPERSHTSRHHTKRDIAKRDSGCRAGRPDASHQAEDPATSAASELQDSQLLTEHIRALRRYAFALVGGSPIADDLVQETLARAIHYLHEGREVRNLRSYLLTILHNVRVDHIKADRRQGDLVPIDEQPQLAVPPSQLDKLACNEAAVAIAALPEDQREVLLLIGLEGLSYQEATDILGVPLGTVMSRLNRGRNAVKAQLGRDDAGKTTQPIEPATGRKSAPDSSPESSSANAYDQ
ncbi:MAG TPA: RNA polymerase sigma factor [Candidatus Nitrosotalea sp.]|jgi:RNA polymerase sigma-70 factor (ECF subfamily)|nr:RNA polymerase sigma factor [Candidatus Nitrosotalea sp.]